MDKTPNESEFRSLLFSKIINFQNFHKMKCQNYLYEIEDGIKNLLDFQVDSIDKYLKKFLNRKYDIHYRIVKECDYILNMTRYIKTDENIINTIYYIFQMKINAANSSKRVIISNQKISNFLKKEFPDLKKRITYMKGCWFSQDKINEIWNYEFNRSISIEKNLEGLAESLKKSNYIIFKGYEKEEFLYSEAYSMLFHFLKTFYFVTNKEIKTLLKEKEIIL